MTTLQTKGDYRERILTNVDNCLTETDLGKGEKYGGKVRDRYDLGDKLLLVTTDRQSAFDRILASIPFKGQVLNRLAQFWFERTRDIVANQVIAVPDGNVTIAEELEEFAACIRGETEPTMDGQRATESLAVIRAGITSVKENRTVDVAEILESE